jgi:FMN phosphatase YigB (HAD superfamily)
MITFSFNYYTVVVSIFFIFVITYLLTNYKKKESTLLYKPVQNKEKIIILWDLHEVVFQRSVIDWAKAIITFHGKWQAIKNTSWPMYKLVFKYFLYLLGIKKGDISSEELIMLAKQQKNNKLVQLIVAIGSRYTPIDDTVNIIKELDRNGYHQHVCSNIGRTIYNHFHAIYPKIFKYFTHVTLVEPVHNKPLIKKPNHQFFINYLKTNNLSAQDIIFIDDKQHNIDAAQQVGMTAIRFINSEQLRKNLIQIGILSDQ